MQRSRSTNLLKADSDIKYKVCVFDLDGVLRIGKNTVANTEYLLRHLNEQLAEESGFDSCLVMSGNTKKDVLKTYVVEADYVLEDVSRLNDIL